MTVYVNTYNDNIFSSSNVPNGKSLSIFTIENVEAGSKIDLLRFFGKPAKKFIVLFGNATSSKYVDVSLNDLQRIKKPEETRADQQVEIWGVSQFQPRISGSGSGAIYNSYDNFGDLIIDSITIGTISNSNSGSPQKITISFLA